MAITICASMYFVNSASADSTVVADQAKGNGVVACRGALEDVANFIIGDRSHASHSTWNSNNPDGRMFTSMTSKHYSDGDGHVTIVAAPMSGGKCDTTYVETFALERTCMSARESIYGDWKFTGELNDTIVLENESGAANLYLTSQGSGNICLVSRRETVFD
ncbi:hypothetical protein [Marinimicrobium alkaliphilum]|uniref:hypothetical protein n=1 Tax=Marinimicrobium alkaliphilum TaxID=2202654 RepID=UPI000DBA5967|nr:hypothetical protein [Marinimicrobium alkaliphilum]